MKQIIKAFIETAVSSSHKIEVDVPKNEKYGDYATNIAIIAAKAEKKSPSLLAKELASILNAKNKKNIFEEIIPTEQGFINFKLSQRTIDNRILSIISKNDNYGQVNAGNKKKVLLEFVSANPTGPLHIGHGRWAVIGDCLANVLGKAGYKVHREFYVNDAGEQIKKLIDSIKAIIDKKNVPEGGYGGNYVAELAKKYANEKDLRGIVLKYLINDQNETLRSLGVKFDKWFFESELHRKKTIQKAIKKLTERNLTFYEGNALWFKSSEYGDDKNRVLIKEDGSTTYFAADIAYHMNKYERGYDKLINVWGTDHHGYVARLKSAMQALGYPAEKLEIIIGQLVALYRGKELVRMSKRTGDMVTLKEVIDEIGPDATRYFLVKTSPNTHLDFDLELAKSKSLDNPVYYVSYAHARICSIIKEAEKAGLKPDKRADLSLLDKDVERKLMLKLLMFEDEIETAATLMQPHRLTTYAEELATIFHNYYHQFRIITGEKELSSARLLLVQATSIVLRNVLKLLGIKAPEKM